MGCFDEEPEHIPTKEEWEAAMTNGEEQPAGTIEPHPSGGKKVPVVEIFGPTIEGEGHLAGAQTFFIRFGLCDYKCKNCDSMHAVMPRLVHAGAKWLDCEEIYQALHGLRQAKQAEHITNVTFSGGNPCIHNLDKLVALLKMNGWNIFVETQGTKCPMSWLRAVDHIVVSPKSPGMGEKFEPEVFKAFIEQIQRLSFSIKIVVFSALDLEFAASVSDIMVREGADGVYEFNLSQHFFLSLGNPYPPEFAINPATDAVEQVGPRLLIGDKNDPGFLESNNKKALVAHLLNRYNIISEDVMKDHRLAHAKFLPQLHVLAWGNETGR